MHEWAEEMRDIMGTENLASSSGRTSGTAATVSVPNYPPPTVVPPPATSSMVGRLVKISEGPYKSMLAVVKEVYEKTAQVQLKSNEAIVVVDLNNLTVWPPPVAPPQVQT